MKSSAPWHRATRPAFQNFGNDFESQKAIAEESSTASPLHLARRYRAYAASLHAQWSLAKTAVRTVGNAISSCAESATCRTIAVGVAVVGLGIATGGLGDVALGAAIGGGIGSFTCHGDAACIARAAITGGAAGVAAPVLGAVGLGGSVLGTGATAGTFASLASQTEAGHYSARQTLTDATIGAATAGIIHGGLSLAPSISEAAETLRARIPTYDEEGGLRLPGIGGDGADEAGKALPPLRQGYVDDFAKLRTEVDAWKAAGADEEFIAREAVGNRRALGMKYKAASPADWLEYEVFPRNLAL